MSIPRTYIIAEIGINHNGCIDTAIKLIDLAIIAGCDAVKFQKREPDICVPEHQKNVMRETPWGEMTYLDYKHKMEFGKAEYDRIDKHCWGRIDWSASPWDIESLDFLIRYYDLPWIKIPSAHLTNSELIGVAAATRIPLILSTGMSTEEEIDKTVQQIYKYTDKLTILHCNSSYPASLDELNLSCIKTLKEKYPHATIGYSGHEFRLGTSVASVYLGAEVVERHITLDRSMWGTDHLSSVEPQGLIKLVSGIRELERAYGDGEITVYDSEVPVRKKLRGY